MVSGEPEADRDDDQAREAGGALKAHAGGTPTRETKAGDQ